MGKPKKSRKNLPKISQVVKKNGDFDEILGRISFRRVSWLSHESRFENVGLLYQILPVMESYADLFDDDSITPDTDYGTWLDVILDFIKDTGSWFFVICVDDQPCGCIWANNWDIFGLRFHACSIGGLAKRGITPKITQATLYRFIRKIFQTTGVNIIRADFAQKNRAVGVALRRFGFSHPETQRVWRIKNGVELTGTILSITRSEFEERFGNEPSAS